jgi:hypothetical protein
LPCGSRPLPSPARMRVLVLIGISFLAVWSSRECSLRGGASAVGVDSGALARANVGGNGHGAFRSGPRRAVGIHPEAVAGAKLRGRLHGSLPQPLGSMPQPLPAGRCVEIFMVRPS